MSQCCFDWRPTTTDERLTRLCSPSFPYVHSLSIHYPALRVTDQAVFQLSWGDGRGQPGQVVSSLLQGHKRQTTGPRTLSPEDNLDLPIRPQEQKTTNLLLWANSANHYTTMFGWIQTIQLRTSFLSRLAYYHATVLFWQETKYLCFSSILSLHSIRCYPGSSLRPFTLNVFRQREAARQKKQSQSIWR